MLESMTIHLHQFIREGQGDTDQADVLREQMYEVWTTLRAEHRSLLDSLSGDLYMLQGKEVLEESGGDDLHALVRVKEAWTRRDWQELLTLLRQQAVRTAVPEPIRAYFRGRCWSSLGYYEAAFCFFDYATHLAPKNDSYAYLALDALVHGGRIDEALNRANAVLRDESSSSRRLFKASDVLFHAARRFEENEARTVYKRIIPILDRALEQDKKLPSTHRLASLTVGGYVHKGLCHEHLEQYVDAKKAYTEALAIDSKSDVALTARALLAYESDQRAALRDFERAAATGTPLVWPYLYLAHDALNNGEFERCTEMARQGMARTKNPTILSNLMEWIAIASARKGATTDDFIELLEDARTLNPFNERLAANLQTMSREGYGPKLIVANDTTPREARDEFSRGLRSAA